MASLLMDSVVHWRKKLEKHTDEETVLNVIRKLSKAPITLEVLQETHIGRCIRQLSKKQGIVGENALALLRKWRSVFSDCSDPKSNSKSSISSKSKKENNIKDTVVKTCPKTDSKWDRSKGTGKSSFSNSSSKNTDKHKTRVCEQSSPSPNSCEKDLFEECEDFESHSFVDEDQDQEYPQLYPGTQLKSSKVKATERSVENLYKPSILKRKLSSEEEIEFNKTKKHKSCSHSSDAISELKQKNKKEKHISSKKNMSPTYSKADLKEKSKHKPLDLTESTKDSGKKSSSKSKKDKVKVNSSVEFTSSEVRFEDCLGFNDIVVKKKSKKSPSASNKKPLSNSNKTSEASSSGKEKVHKSSKSKEKSLFDLPKNSVSINEVDIMSTLPEIQPNYRPLPQRNLESQEKRKKILSNEEAIKFTSSRKEKTNVYSGRKSFFTEVPSLFECCTRVLIDNIDAIEYMGGVPYFLLKPVLERCTPEQLFAIEHFNPYLLEDTHELWEIHCKRDYKLLTPQENETWRELYLRAQEEREKKLRSITANISASMSKSNPVRQVKLAYVDSVAKPPRDVARRQAKHGTGLPVNHVMKPGPPSKATPAPTAPIINSTLSSKASTSNIIQKKPKVAPLMAKTLKSMKMCFRR